MIMRYRGACCPRVVKAVGCGCGRPELTWRSFFCCTTTMVVLKILLKGSLSAPGLIVFDIHEGGRPAPLVLQAWTFASGWLTRGGW